MCKFIVTRQAPLSPSFCVSEGGIIGYLSQGLAAKMKRVKMCKALGFIHMKTSPIATTKTILIPEWPHQLPSCVTLGQLPNILMFHIS